MTREVRTSDGHLVVEEECGCRHAGGSFLPRRKADAEKVGMCAAHSAEYAATHEQAAKDHKEGAS